MKDILDYLNLHGRVVTIVGSFGATSDYLFKHGDTYIVYNTDFQIENVKNINFTDDSICIYLKEN